MSNPLDKLMMTVAGTAMIFRMVHPSARTAEMIRAFNDGWDRIQKEQKAIRYQIICDDMTSLLIKRMAETKVGNEPE